MVKTGDNYLAVDEFARRLEEFQAQLLDKRDGGDTLLSGLVLRAFAEISTAIEELRVAEEELRTQNNELLAMRGALEAERERYRELFDFAPDAYLVIRRDGAITEANHAAAELLRVPQQFLIGKVLFTYLAPAHRRTLRSILGALPSPGDDTTTELEVEIRPRDVTEPVHAILCLSAVRDGMGQAAVYRCMIKDITERRRAEQALEEQSSSLQVLHEIERSVLAAESAQEIARIGLRGLRRAISCRRAGLWLFNPEGKNSARLLAVDFDNHTAVGPGSEATPAELGFDISAWGGQDLLFVDLHATNHSAVAQRLVAEGVHALSILPLAAAGELIGMVIMGTEASEPLPDKVVRFARQCADSLAVGIRNAQLREAEQRAHFVADTLRAANIALTESLDLQAVMDTLLEYLQQLVPYDSANVCLLEDETRAVIRAWRGYEKWTDPATIGGMVFDGEHTAAVGAMLRTRQSLLIDDTRGYPGWEDRPGGSFVRNWLAVPLVAGGHLLGLVGADKTTPGFFTYEHVRLAEGLAAHAAAAIHNAQLYQQVLAGRGQLRTLSRRLVEAQESERRHVARELHDDASQALASLMVDLRLLQHHAGEPEEVLARSEVLKGKLDEVMGNLHRLAVGLRPASLDHLGLVPALRQYALSLGDQHSLRVGFETVGLEAEALAPEVEIALYRIAQEALTNVARHAQASRVDIIMESGAGRLVLIVEDDGVGFDPADVQETARLGLLGMRERAEMVGASLTVESAPGAGTTVFVEVPYDDSHTDR